MAYKFDPENPFNGQKPKPELSTNSPEYLLCIAVIKYSQYDLIIIFCNKGPIWDFTASFNFASDSLPRSFITESKVSKKFKTWHSVIILENTCLLLNG